ncbi:universal stress protein [Pseudonocardia sp. C8]|uniref:universal stress protein n=1 Tax=Pseudonocardia sp. C8 TaxID=2762759 RepID=UPI0016423A94|nr:universal stress protein [Pseudonocardia sp. C8]MBC3191137.1 universal stress protein [Pseudonocardia sp. C8]
MSEQRRGPVVVGVDGSASALDAVRWAAGEAAARRVGLRLVAVFTPLPRSPRHDLGLAARYREHAVEELRGQLTSAAGVVTAAAPEVTVETDLRTGYPAPVLVEESHGASLTVVGSRGLGGFSGLLVGSVAVAIAAHGGSPVLVVRGDRGPDAALPVVLGVDGSPAGESAVGIAFELAARRSVPLRAVHAWSDTAVGQDGAVLIDRQTLETEEREVLAERLAGWAQKFPDVDVQRVVVRDRPAHALVEEAAGAAVVVVGSRGRGGLTGLLLGSVGQALLHHADSPVLIARP